MRTIAIIGGGFSGTAVAVNVLRNAGRDIRLVLIDPSSRTGTGLAYGAARPGHLLNVPASRMSMLHDEPEHLTRWLRSRGLPGEPYDFIPRALYGEYLRDALDVAARARPGALTLIRGRAIGLAQAGSGWQIQLDRATPLHATDVVLAMGNGAPSRLPTAAGGDEWRLMQDPWAGDIDPRLNRNATVALIGTGLTAIDMVLSLDRIGHTGPIVAISRRGLLPRGHASSPISPDLAMPSLIAGMSVREAVRCVRTSANQSSNPISDWRAVIDGLRPCTHAVWRSWTDRDRVRFMRLVRPFWDVHRHRMAPEIHAIIDRLLHAGRLTVRKAGIASIVTHAGHATINLRAGASLHSFEAGLVINCTGPSTDPSRWDDPLVDSMLRADIARMDPLRLGFDTDHSGRVRERAGPVSPTLFAIGPLRRPDLWESIAVPELRVQAHEIALALTGELRTARAAAG